MRAATTGRAGPGPFGHQSGNKVNHRPSSAAYKATKTTVSNIPVSGTSPVT